MTPLGFDAHLRELLLEHYRRPRHRGHLRKPTHAACSANRYCGEALKVELEIEDDVISDIAYTGRVCSVSQTAASLMAEHVIGLSVEETRRAAERFQQMMGAGTPDPQLGEMATLAKVAAFPSRIHCALLSWRALQKALDASATSE